MAPASVLLAFCGVWCGIDRAVCFWPNADFEQICDRYPFKSVKLFARSVWHIVAQPLMLCLRRIRRREMSRCIVNTGIDESESLA